MRKPLLYVLFFISTFTYAQELTVENIWKEYQFFGANLAGFRSMQDGVHYTQRSRVKGEDCITKHSFVEPNTQGEVLVNLSKLKIDDKTVVIDDYEFNPDESKILFTTKTKDLYRRSFFAEYIVYDRKSGEISLLDTEHSPQMLAEYAPNGKHVSYLFENNLFVKDLQTNVVTQLTTDGKKNQIINGGTDWVYEEEFAITKAYTWSPDSKHIAYLRFDESGVPEFSMTYYNTLYPDQYTFKYPKAGEENSKVTAHIVDLEQNESSLVSLDDYEYIPRLKWSDTKNTLIIQTMNRHQNQLNYNKVEQLDGKWTANSFYTENSSTYVEIDDNLLILQDGKTILRTSEIDGYKHIYALDFDGKSTAVTSGNWDVIEFLGIDESNKRVFYTSAEKGAIHKGVYSIQLDGTAKKTLSSETGYNDADFSVGMKYFVKGYSNANTPSVYTLCDSEGKELLVLEDNAALKLRMNKFKLAKQEFITLPGASGELNAYILKPTNFNPKKKYPVYFHVYGGPGSNMVKDEFSGADFMYHQLLTQKGYIVVSVDPRGTMHRGAEFKKSTYLNLGKLETEDFIAAAKSIQKEKWVDANRIGIMGWSYGGFMTSLCMTKGADVFQMGIAVAPVTNWRYYDNIYTERFMRTPAENEAGYDQNSPINFVGKLKGKYLLIHGSGDDNVHYQNTMEMINALITANKQFDLFIYPNKNHGIYGGNTRNHLFTMLLEYTLKNL